MYGLNIDPMNPGGLPELAILKELGVKMVRFSYKDDLAGNMLNLERARFYHNLVESLANQGIESLIIVAYESYPGKPAFTASDEAWNNYIIQFCTRLVQIVYNFWPMKPAYQIWNEPDLAPQPGYEPSLRESVYGQMLTWSNETINSVEAGLKVVGAGLASGDPAWWSRVVESQPGKALIDVNALHPYIQRPEPDWPRPDWGAGYVGDLIRAYQQVFNGEWWITESGVKPEEADQATYLRKMYHTIETEFSEKVKWLNWFCYSDAMVPPYGLIEESSTRKPAYKAYQEVSGGVQ